jgi:hypothetical protein
MKGAIVDLKVRLGCFTAKVSGKITWIPGPPMSGKLGLQVFSQENAMLQFKLSLPPGSAPDVVSQELTLTIGDNPTTVETFPVAQTETGGYEGVENAAITTSLVDIDGVGNRSVPHAQTFVLLDTVPPGEPLDVGLIVTGQT